MQSRVVLILVASIGLPTVRAQQAAPLTITQAVERALRNYPSIRVSQEQMNAAAAGIRLAQTAYLPRVDGLAQVNRATRNTFYGLLLPQGVIPGVDGVPANNFGSVWDSGPGHSGHVAALRLWSAPRQCGDSHGRTRGSSGRR